MMRMKSRGVPELSPPAAGVGGGESEWERRPGGMLVQKRNPDSDQNRVPPPPTIRVRVKYGSVYHEINISSQATFGELKKMLSGPTGLHHEDQKLLFKDKDRASKTFLDVAGVKDRSKMVLTEDPISKEKRFLEMRKNAKMEKASKSISDISFEVDRLAGQVAGYESVISRGGKVGEKEVLNLIEMLMNQLLKLDGIIADGDVKLQRKMQVMRVQKYVETLDMLKIKNSMLKPTTSETQNSPRQHHQPSPFQQHRPSNGQAPPQQPQSRRSYGHLTAQGLPPQQLPPPNPASSGPVVVTTQWETFDAVPLPLPAPPSASKTGPDTGNNDTIMQPPKFNWDLL